MRAYIRLAAPIDDAALEERYAGTIRQSHDTYGILWSIIDVPSLEFCRLFLLVLI